MLAARFRRPGEYRNVFSFEQICIPDLFNIPISCLAFPWEQDTAAEDHMKPSVIEHCAAPDRLATWNEVRVAMSVTSTGAFELRCTCDGYCEIQSDLHGWVRIRNEDMECWAWPEEIPESDANSPYCEGRFA
jgi:hypothetical protein